MGLRQLMTDHPAATKAATVALLAASAALLWVRLHSPASSRPSIWYYDMNTGQLFRAPLAPAPIAAPSGPRNGEPAGVRAQVYACHDCADPADRKIAYLSKYTPAAQAGLNKAMVTDIRLGVRFLMSPDLTDMPEGHLLVTTPESETWIDITSDDAHDATLGLETRCSDGTPSWCE